MILTGGGGGCCSADVQHAGFTAVHLTQSGYTVDVTSNAVRLNTQQCPWS